MEPPNPKASEAAVKSIIGEVFGNVSFEEFERASTTVSWVVVCTMRRSKNIKFSESDLSSLAEIRTFKWNFNPYHG